ncbi:MAG: DNA-formamidopyrimidine glycosylase [Propionibacteriaceae bacterium]|nr:DNA-formamidopyrimidine glycosylase [Propionibacteriaceae bacterium]
MPELPEVETVRRGLANRLDQFVITDLEVCRDRAIASPGGIECFQSGLINCRVGSWKRRGKYLFTELHRFGSVESVGSEASEESAGHWGVHLRMTGQFQWLEHDTPPCKHTRVRFWNAKGQELRFVDLRSFAEMWWVPPGVAVDSVITGLKKLGPEPFSQDFNSRYLQEKFKGSTRSIKAALLDQSVVAGTGNIYADESLFAAGIPPQKAAGELNRKQLERLRGCLIHILELSIGAGGTTFSDFRDLEGVNGNYGGQATVYRRTGLPCLVCGTTIKRMKIAGRSTHWCPQCQK